MEGHVLDSFAVLSYLYGQRGADKLERLLKSLSAERKIKAWLNLINLGEIYYIIAREESFGQADKAAALIKQWPVGIVQPSEAMTLLAARTKASYPMSYADAFVVATAIEKEAAILTGHPEFKKVEDMVQVEWL